ncbi:MAG: sugar transferase [Candidatus Rokubacteria bacterium]|nr:sugar transferase [Candidatus Rokubacteria bacterium]
MGFGEATARKDRGSLWPVQLEPPAAPAPSRVYEWAKRLFDLTVALGALLLFSPLMAIVAYLIRRDSPGPVFFRQTRVGKYGRPFEMLKFRSMYVTTPKYAPKPEDDTTDPRITPVGRVLRQTKLDELPQLFNVLRGDMSLVGPRPEMPFVVEGYSEGERLPLSVVPGVTGLWQVSTARHKPIHENVQYDLHYIASRSFGLDFKILVATLRLCAASIRRMFNRARRGAPLIVLVERKR